MKEEFINILRLTLANEVDSSVIEENAKYYKEYIDGEIRKGRSEEDVINELGDPRLIAKTIMEVNPTQSGNSQNVEDDMYTDTSDDLHMHRSGIFGTRFRMWVIITVVVLFIILVIYLLGAVVVSLLPILFPFVLVVGMIRMLRNRT